MSLKMAMLGLLVERRGYGYDLASRFERRFPGWDLNPNSIYQSLSALERNGLACRVPEEARQRAWARGGEAGAQRIMYEATGDGVATFEAWMGERSRVAPMREELHLKLGLAQRRHLPQLIEETYEHERECLERLEACSNEFRFEELVRQGKPWKLIWEVAVRDAEMAQFGAKIQWLQRLRDCLIWLLENHPAYGKGKGPGAPA